MPSTSNRDIFHELFPTQAASLKKLYSFNKSPSELNEESRRAGSKMAPLPVPEGPFPTEAATPIDFVLNAVYDMHQLYVSPPPPVVEDYHYVSSYGRGRGRGLSSNARGIRGGTSASTSRGFAASAARVFGASASYGRKRRIGQVPQHDNIASNFGRGFLPSAPPAPPPPPAPPLADGPGLSSTVLHYRELVGKVKKSIFNFFTELSTEL
jgi:hypothetical protein